MVNTLGVSARWGERALPRMESSKQCARLLLELAKALPQFSVWRQPARTKRAAMHRVVAADFQDIDRILERSEQEHLRRYSGLGSPGSDLHLWAESEDGDSARLHVHCGERSGGQPSPIWHGDACVVSVDFATFHSYHAEFHSLARQLLSLVVNIFSPDFATANANCLYSHPLLLAVVPRPIAGMYTYTSQYIDKQEIIGAVGSGFRVEIDHSVICLSASDWCSDEAAVMVASLTRALDRLQLLQLSHRA